MGWFYGFKLHLIVNEKGDLLSVKLTPGNIADKDRSLMKILTKNIIESIHDELKNMCQIEHTRHRSPINFLVNLLSGLIAYTFLWTPKPFCLG